MPKVNDFIVTGAKEGVVITDTGENKTVFVPYDDMYQLIRVMKQEHLDSGGGQ